MSEPPALFPPAPAPGRLHLADCTWLIARGARFLTAQHSITKGTD